ncbi:hypothetical protein, partial [Paracidovorax cattleyae]|uniref:hypothetical protein n=1 Tax=Paracidovorax cattleyae TaxID=80868 RepID=UPI001E5B50F2
MHDIAAAPGPHRDQPLQRRHQPLERLGRRRIAQCLRAVRHRHLGDPVLGKRLVAHRLAVCAQPLLRRAHE